MISWDVGLPVLKLGKSWMIQDGWSLCLNPVPIPTLNSILMLNPIPSFPFHPSPGSIPASDLFPTLMPALILNFSSADSMAPPRPPRAGELGLGVQETQCWLCPALGLSNHSSPSPQEIKRRTPHFPASPQRSKVRI